MVAFRYDTVRIDSFALNIPTDELTSAAIEDRIAPLYERLGIPLGTLERLSGVRNRFVWPAKYAPSKGATGAVEKALEGISFDRSKIGALFSCSVSRDLFEPATACFVHRNLGLSESVMALDVTNACIGFSNGLLLLANLIESRVLDAGIVVSSENPGRIIESNFKLLERKGDSLTRDDLLKVLPTFTLGCGAVAYVLCHESVSDGGHRFLGGVSNSATDFTDLCSGNGDFCVLQEEEIHPIMETESSKLIAAAAKLGARTWSEASEVLGWDRDAVDHCVCHQVGRQVNEAFYRTLGLDFAKDYATYKEYGNMISAALPAAVIMGADERGFSRGDKIVLTAFGSGLHAIFTGIEW